MFYSYFLPLAALVLGPRVFAGAVVSFSGSLSALEATPTPLRARAPLVATGGNATLSSSSSFTWIRSGVFSFSPAAARVAPFPDDGIATARPFPAGAARFDAAPVPVGGRLPRATRNAPVTVPVLSSSVSAAGLAFPRRARAAAGGASGDSARFAALRGGPSSTGVPCVAVVSAVFLDLAPTRRLVVVGAGAGTGSTDWLRVLPRRCVPFVVSASRSGFGSSGSGLAAGAVAAFVPRAVLRIDFFDSAASLSVAVDPADFVVARERRAGPGSGTTGFDCRGARSVTSGVITFLALLVGLVGAIVAS
jgi:hypothetical protein